MRRSQRSQRTAPCGSCRPVSLGCRGRSSETPNSPVRVWFAGTPRSSPPWMPFWRPVTRSSRLYRPDVRRAGKRLTAAGPNAPLAAGLGRSSRIARGPDFRRPARQWLRTAVGVAYGACCPRPGWTSRACLGTCTSRCSGLALRGRCSGRSWPETGTGATTFKLGWSRLGAALPSTTSLGRPNTSATCCYGWPSAGRSCWCRPRRHSRRDAERGAAVGGPSSMRPS